MSWQSHRTLPPSPDHAVPHAVLFTQCMQRDFVGPVSAHVPLPNALHVGRDESVRIMGRDPSAGPVAQLMNWARAQDADALTIVHIRDWHDPDDPAQAGHMALFGRHCIAGTPGARLVLNLDDEADRRVNERYVNTTTLNDFEGTTLSAVLDEVRAEHGDDLRVGVVGVWTEAKVTFLLYELATRCGLSQLATCSALTASASRTQHFNALDQLRKLLGVDVLNSVGAFAGWLLPGTEPLQASRPEAGYGPKVRVEDAVEQPPLSPDDLDLTRVLYRDAATVALTPIGGGFSGAQVYRAAATDARGHALAPTVLKLGRRNVIAEERVAFEQVEAVLGNDAPTLRGFADIGERAGLKFAYAAMGGTGVKTFKELYEEGMQPARVRVVLHQVFSGILDRLTAAANYEPLGLLDEYGFSAHFAPTIQARVEAIMGAPVGDRVEVAPGFEVRNPAHFYRDVLPTLERPVGEFHYRSYVHGDLNAANVLLDARDNVWIIDFARASRSHVLMDVAKFENDLQYILTPINNDEELRAALALTRALTQVEDLAAPLPAAIRGVDQSVVRRCLGTLRALRSHTARLCREERNPAHLAVALLRYAAHTLSFDEANIWQKRWALYAAGCWAELIERDAVRNRALRVDWVDHPSLGTTDGNDGLQLGITICPGRADRGRDLDEDIASLVRQGVDKVVCLLPMAELEHAGVGDLGERVRAAGLTFMQAPILDQQAAPVARIAEIVSLMDEALGDGHRVAVHCMGGLGRSGMVVAGLLTRRGLTHQEAIAVVRNARGPRAVETQVQEHLVRDLARHDARTAAS